MTTTDKPPALELGREYPPANEAAFIEQMKLAMATAAAHPAGPNGTALRQGHSYMHGCVGASFVVEPNLPDALRVGVFKTPATFAAWIRFSNASAIPAKTADSQPDMRGMGIKLLGVPGDKILDAQQHATTQDFSLLTSPTFTSRSAEEFVGFVKAVTSPNPADAGAYFGNPANGALVGRLMAANAPCRHVLEASFWSTTPYRFGDEGNGARAVKYHVRPSAPKSYEVASTTDNNYLRQNLARTLSEQAVSFDFCVQFQEDAATMPIEDPTVAWSSPFIKLATITLPVQQFDTPERDSFGQNLSFNPWHSLPEHRPLGGINRARRSVYDALVALRQQQNHAPTQEPT